MQNEDDRDLDSLKSLLENRKPAYDPDQSLQRVLSHARRQTHTRDVVTFFASWVWVLFAGFGASLHQACHSDRQTLQRPRRPVRPKPASPDTPTHQNN